MCSLRKWGFEKREGRVYLRPTRGRNVKSPLGGRASRPVRRESCTATTRDVKREMYGRSWGDPLLEPHVERAAEARIEHPPGVVDELVGLGVRVEAAVRALRRDRRREKDVVVVVGVVDALPAQRENLERALAHVLEERREIVGPERALDADLPPLLRDGRGLEDRGLVGRGLVRDRETGLAARLLRVARGVEQAPGLREVPP
jgi:hypothetical protein